MSNDQNRSSERIFRERPKARTIEDYEPPLAREEESFTPFSRTPARQDEPKPSDESADPQG